MEWKSAADIEGEWKDPSFTSSLIDRCKESWHTPTVDLTNLALLTYLHERIALQVMIPEARKRVERKFDDHTERFVGELAEALHSAEIFESKRSAK